MEKKLGQEPAFPIPESRVENLPTGMSKRFYAACAAKDDFDEFSDKLQEAIAGNKPSLLLNRKDYIIWLAKGRAIWRYMQADELLKQENEQTT